MFKTNIYFSRQKRLREIASKSSYEDHSNENKKVIPLDCLTLSHPMSNMEHTVQDIHDILESYYKVARKRFVDTVCMQGASHFLITGSDTPLRLFSPALVNSMTPEQLEEIVGEDSMTKRRRKQLTKEKDELEAGKRILF